MTHIDNWSEETKYAASRIWDYAPDEYEYDYGTCDFCGAEGVETVDVDDVFLTLPKENWQHNICEQCEDRMASHEDDYEELY